MNNVSKPVGFWTCWSLTVGIMIGSGIFILPAVLAPYGMISFAGWTLTAGGSICLALVMARLAGRTTQSGGVYIYARDAFGNLPGFLVAWGYWISYWMAIPAVAIAFVGYLGVFVPGLTGNVVLQALAALALIWALTGVNMRSLSSAGFFQVLMTFMKIVPLLLVILYGILAGDADNLPKTRPEEGSFIALLAATALLTMWAFSGLEAGTVPAGQVKDPTRTIPRAIVFGTLTVAFIYIAATFAVMRLVPAEVLTGSEAPFSEAVRGLGTWAPAMIAIGAMVSTAGSLNGLAPKRLILKNGQDVPRLSLVMGSILASILLLMNFSKGLIGAFTFLAMMSTLTLLLPLLVSALAELKQSIRSTKGWAIIAVLATGYSLFAIFGSGASVLFWGLVLLAVGIPVFYLFRGDKAPLRK